MEEKVWLEIKKWIVQNYRFKEASTGIGLKLNEENICFLEVTLMPREHDKYPPVIATYKGVYDDTFLTLAKVNIDAQFLQGVKCFAPSLNKHFLHLLN